MNWQEKLILEYRQLNNEDHQKILQYFQSLASDDHESKDMQ